MDEFSERNRPKKVRYSSDYENFRKPRTKITIIEQPHLQSPCHYLSFIFKVSGQPNRSMTKNNIRTIIQRGDR